MKFPLKWHKECLANFVRNFSEKEARMDRFTEEVNSDRAAIRFYMEQIDRAEDMGKDGFDADKFMRKVPKEVS